MSVLYYIHAGARLRRILRQKDVVILHYAKKVGLTPQGLYRYFSQPVIKREKLEVLLEAVPITKAAFYQWDSLDDSPLHQGELLLLYLVQRKIKVGQLASQLHLQVSEMNDWCDCTHFSTQQLDQLYEVLGLTPAYFSDPAQAQKGVNWLEAYLDKCMEAQQYLRKVSSLEKKLNALESKQTGQP
ncbi:hypothetical protein CLV51_101437 [Chitinophaga niastensis]|uniref:Uncharacterized protein n=1 Tax=Chitinophaga niastensis TaxID=536980 RepID=A0A2P8HSC1_CHINA|nr:hypothetical protein [Chitinophaga niastensis]PSL49107.1 hypothetical protein CLV51_101437 [Chitinophaga niastensis]